jgi:S-formylglutathione hydrolase FrmB
VERLQLLNSLPGDWNQVDVAGHACDVYEPPERNPHGFVLIYLHDVDQASLRGSSAFGQEFASRGLPVIAPLTGRSWWTDKIVEEFDPRLTAERHLLDNILPYVASRWNAVPPRLALLGIGMGGQGALRFTFKHPNRFPICAAIAPAIDYQVCFNDDETLPQIYADREAARQDTATLHVHPLNWPRNTWFASDPADDRWHDSAQKLRMKLWALGIMHECDLETTGGGHSWAYYERMAPQALQFLADRLEHERARVI